MRLERLLSKDAGYLQYRFGRRDAIDLAYPDLGARPSNVFSSGQLMFSGGGGAWLRFGKEPFAYTIFTAIGRWGPAGAPASMAGVAVQKAGKPFANFPCRDTPESEIGPQFFETAGLRGADPPNDFEFRMRFSRNETASPTGRFESASSRRTYGAVAFENSNTLGRGPGR